MSEAMCPGYVSSPALSGCVGARARGRGQHHLTEAPKGPSDGGGPSTTWNSALSGSRALCYSAQPCCPHTGLDPHSLSSLPPHPAAAAPLRTRPGHPDCHFWDPRHRWSLNVAPISSKA